MIHSIDWSFWAGQALTAIVVALGAGTVGWALSRRHHASAILQPGGLLGPGHHAMDPADPVITLSFVDQFNNSVRSIVTILLTLAFIAAFLFTDKVSKEVFATVYTSAVAYWFASREAKARYLDQPTTTTTTPSATIRTGPTPPAAAG